MNKNNEGLKFIVAEAKNFKNIASKRVDIDGRSLIIFGPNEAGKSSFLQILLSPLDSKYTPSQAVRKGEERGSLHIELAGELGGEHMHYTIDQTFSHGSQNGKLVITNKNGDEMPNAKTFIKSLIGKIGFDPFEFIRSSPAKQIEVLMNFLSDEEREKYRALGAEQMEIKNRVTYLKDKQKELYLQSKSHGYTAEQLKTYEHRKDSSELEMKQSTMTQAMETWTKVNSGIESREKDEAIATEKITGNNLSIDKKLAEIQKLQEEIRLLNDANTAIQIASEKRKQEIIDGKEWLVKNPKPNAEEISLQLQAIKEHNSHHDKIQAFAQKAQEAKSLFDEISEKEEKVKSFDSQRQAIIAGSSIPVPGLTFSEKEVFYEGLPFEETSINKAKIIEVGIRIGKALNRNLRVMIIWDASLLDKKTYNTVLRLCEEDNYQLLMEKVSWEQKELEILFAEEAL